MNTWKLVAVAAMVLLLSGVVAGQAFDTFPDGKYENRDDSLLPEWQEGTSADFSITSETFREDNYAVNITQNGSGNTVLRHEHGEKNVLQERTTWSTWIYPENRGHYLYGLANESRDDSCNTGEDQICVYIGPDGELGYDTAVHTDFGITGTGDTVKAGNWYKMEFEVSVSSSEVDFYWYDSSGNLLHSEEGIGYSGNTDLNYLYLNNNDNDGSTVLFDKVGYYSPNSPPTVTFNDPQNTTRFNYTTPVDVETNDTDGDDYQCNVTADTTQIGETNQSVETFTDTVRSDLGQHNISVSCQDSQGGTSTETVYYTVDNYELLNQSSPDTYETANTTYEGSWQLGSMVDELAVSLYWNGTRRTDRTYTGSGVRTENVSQFFRPPLVQQNRTNASWRFQYTVNYTLENGTQTVETVNSTAADQEVWIGYFVDSFQFAEDRVIEALDVDTSFTNTTAVPDSPAQANSSIWYNGSTTAGNAATFHAPILSNQTIQSVNTSGYGQTTVSFRNRSKTLATAPENVTVYNKILTDCSADSASQEPALTFTVRNEENNTDTIDASLGYNFDTTDTQGRDTDTFAFERSGASVDTCIYPTWAAYRVTGPIQYDATDYTSRTYTLNNVTISNQTGVYNLYLLADDLSTAVYFNVQENDGTAVEGATIKTMRYFIGQDAYLTVSKAETDSEGVASTYLRLDNTHYKYIISKDGDVLLETSPQLLQCDTTPCTKTFIIDPETVSPYFEHREGFSYNCGVNEATDTQNASIQCTVDHSSDSMEQAQLRVDERQVVGWTTHCNITVVNTGESMVCQLGNLSEHAYRYTLTGEKDGFRYTLDTGLVDRLQSFLSGHAVYAAFIVFTAITGLGLFSPVAAILSAVLGFLVAAKLGLMSVGLSSLAGAVIVALIAAMEAKR